MQLHFHRLGHGPPLILLHGLFGSLGNWLGVARPLAAHFTVFALDQRNHGRSPHSAEMSYPALATDVGDFLDAHGLVSAHVLGHSMGGKVAMQFALANPARVKRLVVVDITPRALPPQHGEIFEALLALDLSTLHSREEMDAVLAARLPDAVLRRFLLKSVVSAGDGAFRWQFNLAGLRANYARLTAAVSGGRPFAKPVLFLRGESSDYVQDRDRPEIERLFPETMVRTVAGAGHWVPADAPVEFTRAVLEFLMA